MKDIIKNFLKRLGLYYVVQGNFRNFTNYVRILFYRFSFSRYKGSGFTCNFCDSQYQKFVPRHPPVEDEEALKKYKVIAGDGEDVYCPFCGSTCRERLILLMLKETESLRNKKILHLSPEKKIFQILKRNNQIITADVEPGFYKLIDKNIIRADARRLPFEDETFDLAIGNHIMEHIPEDTIAMKEIFRVLKVGGRAIVQVPFSQIISATIEEPYINNPIQQSKLFGQKDHVRIYNLKDYLNRLVSCGFSVLYEEPDFDKRKRYALQKDEGFINCRKLNKSLVETQ